MKFGRPQSRRPRAPSSPMAVRIDGVALKKGDIAHARAPVGARGGGRASASSRRGSSRATSAKTRRRVRLAERLAGAHLRCSPPFTGRVNLFAERQRDLRSSTPRPSTGSMRSTRRSPSRPCRPIAPSPTATWSRPSRSFRLRRQADARGGACGAGPAGAIAVQPFKPMRIGVVSTMLPGLKPSVVAKTLRVLEARLAPAGARIVARETRPA